MLHAIKNENGIALIIALMLMLMLSIIGLGIIKSANDEVAIAGNELNEMKAFYAAESGLDKASAAIQTYYETVEAPPTSFPAETLSIGGITMGYATVPGTYGKKTLTKGTLAALKAYVQPYDIQSTGYDSSHSTAFTLEQSFEVAMVPLFQFGIFYNTDLEIAPGVAMTIDGRVHSNRNIYVQSDNGLTMESYTTATGNIYHGRKPGSGLSESGGDVKIKGLDGNYHSMKDGADWLDATQAHWFDTASVRWGGRVQDSSFGQDALNLPINSPADSSHKIIERSGGGSNPYSYETKADLKIIDGQAFFEVGGVWTNVTAALVAAGALSETTFHDKREGADITVVDIDMGVLKGSAYIPTNGVVYISDQRSGLRGARLNNAEAIGAPLTIACENPFYTVGDINTSSKVPMAIIADALTILSDNWSDDPARAASAITSDRLAASTDINFCYITGNKETGAGSSGYNGGVENLPRFLEDWGGKTLTFRGSIVNLWESQMVSGDWSLSYYVPPTRDWAFDPDLDDLANMPPGTPTVRAFIRWGWKQIDVGYNPSDFAAIIE